jgi:hypothetical protein
MYCPNCKSPMKPITRYADGKEIRLQGMRCTNFDCGRMKKKEETKRAGRM